MKTMFLFAAALLFTITACDISHKIGIENNSVTDGNNTTNECTSVEAFEISSIKNLSQAVDARELFASIGFKDVADKLDAKIDTLVQDAIADALLINDATIGEDFAANKNVMQAIMAECDYGFAKVDKLMLSNAELNKIDASTLKNMSDDEKKALRTKLQDSAAAMTGQDTFLAVNAKLKEEKKKSIEERVKAIETGSAVSTFGYFKPAFFCSFCEVMSTFSNCGTVNPELLKMCELALDGKLFDAKKADLKTLAEKYNADLKVRLDEIKTELPAALKLAEQNLKDAETACAGKDDAACSSIDALKKALELLKAASAEYAKDPVAYATKSDAAYIAITAEITAIKAELARLDSPCVDPLAAGGEMQK